MQILNLINKEKSDIDYSISRFPDGEVQITLGEFSHKESIVVKCRITNAEELFILAQIMDILDRHDVLYTVEIYYLMSMRMDRVMDFNRPFSLMIVAKMLKMFKARKIYILEPHSNRLLWDMSFFRELPCSETWQLKTDFFSTYQILFPDAGARTRYEKNLNSKYPSIFCSKIRDVNTGKLSGFKIENPEDIKYDQIMIIDDLCDGGGTFCGIASAVREVTPNISLSIFVTHMVNPRGIENLSKTFDHVWFTNSYKDWKKDWEEQSIPFPENVTQIEVV